MCGIVGLFNKKDQDIDRNKIEKMMKVIAHRGPDAEGIFVEKNIGLGHRRLSIVDISENGTQPMYSHDNKYVIVFNGEIYNYKELKKELSSYGVHFQNDTDTEMIIEAYRRWGSDCVKRFNGMWSFILVDKENETIFVSRDRFGVKPLYIFENSEFLAFASEIKSILEIFPDEKQVDEVAVARYMRFVQEDFDEHTFYKNIHSFPKATNRIYSVLGDRVSDKLYWKLGEESNTEYKTVRSPYKKFDALFRDAIKIRLQADVPVGASLSGGLDSSSIVGVANKVYGVEMNTFSSIYTEKDCDEKEFIDCINEHSNSRANYIYPDQTDNIIGDLKDMIYYHDGPCESASPYSGYCVYRGVGNKVKVLLDGQGADELFGGYLFFFNAKLKEILQRNNTISKLKGIKIIAIFSSVWPGLNIFEEELLVKALGSHQYKDFIKKYRKKEPREEWINAKIYTDEIKKIDLDIEDVPNPMKSVLDRELYAQFNYKLLPRILHDVDRNSMAHSLEVRLPFLDYRIVEFAFSLKSKYKIRNSWTKYVVRKSMKKYLPKKIYSRRQKMGFPAPFNKWLIDYKDKFRDYIESFKERNILIPNELEKYYQEHLNGTRDWSHLLFHVVSLEMWLQEYIDSEHKWQLEGSGE